MSNELKATPGPWFVRLVNGDTHIYAGDESIMCNMNYYPWVPFNDADWPLIASAPELYEALQAFVDNSSCQVNQPDECERAEQALKKARGEQ